MKNNSKLINHILIIVYIILYALCIIGFAIITHLFFNTNTYNPKAVATIRNNNNNHKYYVGHLDTYNQPIITLININNPIIDNLEQSTTEIKLNNTQLLVSKISLLIYICIIMPLLVWCIYAFKTKIKNTLPHFVNNILVIIFIIIYCFCLGGNVFLIYKLFNTTNLVILNKLDVNMHILDTTPSNISIPTNMPTTIELCNHFCGNGTYFGEDTYGALYNAQDKFEYRINCMDCKIVNILKVNTLELNILKGTIIIFFILILPVIIYCVYVLRNI